MDSPSDEDVHMDSSDDPQFYINPSPPANLTKEEIDVLKGDGIGDTAYTHRWVLKSWKTIIESYPTYLIDGDGTSTEVFNRDKHGITELEESVEEAACHLWDMTIEKDAVLHLLNMEEIDVLETAQWIILKSKAPRLTELIIGIVSNMCSEEETCERIFNQYSNLVDSTFHVLFHTTDVPTMAESFRLLHLLIWHRLHRKDSSTWSSCPVLKGLCTEAMRDLISHILMNCLSDSMLAKTFTLLVELLFIDPEKAVEGISVYDSEDFISGLTHVFLQKFNLTDDDDFETVDTLADKALECLYALLDSQARKTFEKVADQNPTIENYLIKCVRHEGKAFGLQRLIVRDSEKFCRYIALCQAIVPVMKDTSIVMIVGKMFAIIYGQTDEYHVYKSRTNKQNDLNIHPAMALLSMKSNGTKPVKDNGDLLEEDVLPIMGPPKQALVFSPSAASNPVVPVDIDEIPEPLESNVVALRESLENYCYYLFSYLWSTTNKRLEKQRILNVLDECHAYEVIFIFDCVRKKDPLLIPRLQEELLDSGTHRRLVNILAHMYQ